MSTPIVTLYGGPGTGKSTTAAQLFAAWKQEGRNVELAHEVAKDYTWEGADGKLAFQPLVMAKQMWRYERLEGQVDLIVTDTSTLLGLLYGTDMPYSFYQWLVDDYRRRNHINILLERNPMRPYNPSGRRQSEAQAKSLDIRTRALLDSEKIEYETCIVGTLGEHVPSIKHLVDVKLGWA